MSRAAACAIVGGGLGGLVAYLTLRHGGARAGRDRRLRRPTRTRRRPGGVRAAAIRQRRCAPRATATACRASFPGLAVRAARRRERCAARRSRSCDGYHPTVEEFLDHVAEARDRSGWDESFRPARVARVRAVDGGFALDGDGRRSASCCSRRATRARVPAGARGRPARRARVRAARVRGRGRRRRRRDGGGDRVAERARRRRARRLRPAARARPAAAECRAPVLHAARARRASTATGAERAESRSFAALAPSYPPGPRLGRAARARPTREGRSGSSRS